MKTTKKDIQFMSRDQLIYFIYANEKDIHLESLQSSMELFYCDIKGHSLQKLRGLALSIFKERQEIRKEACSATETISSAVSAYNAIFLNLIS